MGKPRLTTTPDRPVSEHLAELRARIMVILVALTVGTVVLYWYVPWLCQGLILLLARFDLKLAFFTLTGAFVTRVKLALAAASIGLSPLIFYQVLAFIVPGLKTQERNWLFKTLFWLIVSFSSGLIFGYYVLIPRILSLLISAGQSYMTPVLSGEKYLSLIALLGIINGCCFVMPVALIGWAKLGLLSFNRLKKGRKYFWLLLLVMEGVLASQSDLVSLVLLAAPLIVLYELSIWIGLLMERKRSVSVPTDAV